MSRPQFTIAPIREGLLGKGPRDWTCYPSFTAPAIPDSIEIISLGDRYIFSLGAHATHGFLLMDRNKSNPLTVASAQLSCATLAFATDSPVVLEFGSSKRPLPEEMAFSTTFRSTTMRSALKYSELVGQIAELAFEIHVELPDSQVLRRMTRKRPSTGQCYHYPWPGSPSVCRAISAYSVGVLSIVPSSRILNFWRAVEAVCPTRQSRSSLFSTIGAAKVAPVWSDTLRIPITGHRQQCRDTVRDLRRTAMIRWKELTRLHGTVDGALQHLYEQRRGKAAHADQMSLEYDFSTDIANQLADASLLRFAARVAVEQSW